MLSLSEVSEGLWYRKKLCIQIRFFFIFFDDFYRRTDEWVFLVREFEPRTVVAEKEGQKSEDSLPRCYELRLEKQDGPKLTFSGQVVQASDTFDGALSKGSCLRISSNYFLESFSGGFMVVHVK